VSECNERGPRTLKRFCIQVQKHEYIELALREGISERANRPAFVTIGIFKDGKKIESHLPKPKASHLSLMLSQLVTEGNNLDLERLKQKYPDQKNWFIY
jgi:hypothetical protein